MYDRRRAEALAQHGQTVVAHDAAHLEGHTGHAEEDAAVPIEPHPAGGAAHVGEHGTAIGQVGLGTVGLQQIGGAAAHALEEVHDVLFHLGKAH